MLVFHEIDVADRYQMKKNVSVFHRVADIDLQLLHKSVFDSLEGAGEELFFSASVIGFPFSNLKIGELLSLLK